MIIFLNLTKWFWSLDLTKLQRFNNMRFNNINTVSIFLYSPLSSCLRPTLVWGPSFHQWALVVQQEYSKIQNRLHLPDSKFWPVLIYLFRSRLTCGRGVAWLGHRSGKPESTALVQSAHAGGRPDELDTILGQIWATTISLSGLHEFCWLWELVEIPKS